MPNVFTTTPAIPGNLAYTYALDTDLDIQWGKSNVDKWADADNDNNAAKKLARRAWALGRAERYINGKLKQTLYDLPFPAAPNTPNEIRDLVVTLAGVYLYSSPRGLADGDETNAVMMQHKEDVDLQLRNIVAGIQRLSIPTTVQMHPLVVKDEEVEV